MTPPALLADTPAAHLKLLRLPDPTGKSFLHLGAGDGWHCAIMRQAGAATVLGLDADDAPIPGQHDIILAIAALDGAPDPIARLRAIRGALAPGGRLILETALRVGPAKTPADASLLPYARVRRVLDGMASRLYRIPGATQRYILHASERRRMVLFFDTPPMTGKTTIATRLALSDHDAVPAARPPRLVVLDHQLNLLQNLAQAAHPAHAPLIAAITELRPSHQDANDRLLRALGARGLIPALVDFIVETVLGDADMLIWDGTVAPECRPACRGRFLELGFVVWSATPEAPVADRLIDIPAALAHAGRPALI